MAVVPPAGLEVVPGSTTVLVPTEITGYTFAKFLLGGHHYCAQPTNDPRWYCRGWNAAGQLLLGDTATRSMPDRPVCATP